MAGQPDKVIDAAVEQEDLREVLVVHLEAIAQGLSENVSKYI